MTNKLRVINSASSPPRPLRKHGLALWRAIHERHSITDASRIEMLLMACLALDRAEACRAQIDDQGETIKTKGGLKEHPLIKHELAARAFVVRTLCRLGLEEETSGKRIGRPATGFIGIYGNE